jgi:ABC-2 type transport system permease protein
MGTVFVGIGVGISAACARDSRATTAAVAVYLVLVVLWNLIAGGIQAGARALGLIAANSQPAWLQFISIFPPNRAAIAAFRAAVDGGRVFATDPFASVWFPTLLLLVWLVVPTAAGYLRFRKADIA